MPWSPPLVDGCEGGSRFSWRMLSVSICLPWRFWLHQFLKRWGFEVLDGTDAWNVHRSLSWRWARWSIHLYKIRRWWLLRWISGEHFFFFYLSGKRLEIFIVLCLVLPCTLQGGIFLHSLWFRQSHGGVRYSVVSSPHDMDWWSNQQFHMPHDHVVMSLKAKQVRTLFKVFRTGIFCLNTK